MVPRLRLERDKEMSKRCEPPEGWQPIETAPRDGTQVLVYARVLHPEKWGIYLDPKICAASYHPDAGWCVCEVRDATHWRPLPAPPEGQP